MCHVIVVMWLRSEAKNCWLAYQSFEQGYLNNQFITCSYFLSWTVLISWFDAYSTNIPPSFDQFLNIVISIWLKILRVRFHDVWISLPSSKYCNLIGWWSIKISWSWHFEVPRRYFLTLDALACIFEWNLCSCHSMFSKNLFNCANFKLQR